MQILTILVRGLAWFAALSSLGLASCTPVESICAGAGNVLTEIKARYDFPGATLAIALPDGTVCEMAAGVSDRETRRAMRSSDRMLSGSTGKTFVSATALHLAGQGKLSLDDPIAKWLGGEPFFAGLANANVITIRHLLSHSSGLIDHVYLEAYAHAVVVEKRAMEPRDLIAFILDQPALFAPGEGYSYTDTGYILLGLIIEKASGRSYYDVLRETFLERFNLERTSPSVTPKLAGLVPGYLATDNPFDLPVKTLDADGVMSYDPVLEWTGGGLISNSVDLARWGRILYGGRALDWDYRAELFRGGERGKEDALPRYGLGVRVMETPLGLAYGHGGWIPGYRTQFAYYADIDAAIAIQINTDIAMMEDDSAIQVLRRKLESDVLPRVKR